MNAPTCHPEPSVLHRPTTQPLLALHLPEPTGPFTVATLSRHDTIAAAMKLAVERVTAEWGERICWENLGEAMVAYIPDAQGEPEVIVAEIKPAGRGA